MTSRFDSQPRHVNGKAPTLSPRAPEGEGLGDGEPSGANGDGNVYGLWRVDPERYIRGGWIETADSHGNRCLMAFGRRGEAENAAKFYTGNVRTLGGKGIAVEAKVLGLATEGSQ
jgi:hypothetical protein